MAGIGDDDAGRFRSEANDTSEAFRDGARVPGSGQTLRPVARLDPRDRWAGSLSMALPGLTPRAARLG